MLSNTWSFVRTFEKKKMCLDACCGLMSVISAHFSLFCIIKKKTFDLTLQLILSSPLNTLLNALQPHLTVPSGSTRSRCLASPLCMPDSTYDPGLVVLFRTRKSPSSFSSFSASRRLIIPWYHVWTSSSSCPLKASERTRRGLELSMDAAL